ncbi:MAG: PilC/PilY family type IV pilus protein [Deltaproteobacteria bacterium]|nr:PilC/PilY family type IV pilus protein [Deltaproteobacteria bacterium]
MSVKKFIIIALITVICLSGGISRAEDDTDEAALFTSSLAPDALIILDLSGSMDWNPEGGTDIWGNSSCNGSFHSYSGWDHTTNCSRLAIAKRAIFNILDDNGDNKINVDDETSLGVRIGYMRFYDGDDTAANYSSGNNKLTKAIAQSYSSIFCNTTKSTGCTISSTCAYSCSTDTKCVNSECANSGTPLAASLNEAKLYLDYHKSQDGLAGACRQKFAILITDGADTYACSGDGSETQANMYKRRRESVAKAKALADAGYRVFVIGFGKSMPDYLENTLNWMAYFGGTDNPLVANTGTTSAYNPSAVTSCGDSTTTGTCNGSSTSCYATSNDPGNTSLSGYAFIAADGDEIAAQLKLAFNIIREANYSFSQASVQLNRTVDENFIYEGTIQPISGDPFWYGHLKKYSINNDGSRGSQLWDAGALLMNTDASVRNIKTYKAGAMIDFTTANLTNANLSVSSDATRSMVVGFFRGEGTYNLENWKLGDIFRSKPITVGTPSSFFEDNRDTNNAFASYRSSHARASSPYTGRVVLVGANDGQLHSFKTSDGSEAWSFIPPNLLSRLKMIAHSTHPTTLTHQSYVDGPVTVADAWVPATASSGTSKSASDWQTLLLFGEGQGAGTNLWSSSTYCDSGFNQIYTTSYPYYCGYYSLNVTSPLSPAYKWRLGVSASAAPYLGAPWSTPMVGRILVGGNEKWAGFIGGGYSSPGAANSGKGLFIFDMVDGNLLWSYTKADNSSLNYPMPAPPAIVDTDGDGFIDTVYIGDMGSNMWRFKLCKATDSSSCGTTNWTGGLFYDATASNIRPIFTAATVAKDGYNNTWVYWGTGDKLDPTSPNAQEKLFALKDIDRTSTRRLNDMENLTSAGSTYSGSGYGWYMNLNGHGEKMLAEPTVFGGVVYFTTYTPPSGNDPCAQGGVASLYGINYTTGAGALDVATPAIRSMTIGTGIASAPVVTMRPGTDPTPDLYVTTSGGGGISGETQRVSITPRGLANRTNIIYWKDTRIE